ncbi:MAG: type 1 glutamine amidotransferase [Gammaproteobacteria bacterium]
MRIHYLQHVAFEGPGSIEQWAKNRGHELAGIRLYAGDSFPNQTEVDWLIVMGGPMNVYSTRQYPWLIAEKHFIKETIEQNKIVLGICLGAQLLADVLGTAITTNPYKEIGWFPVMKSDELAGSALSSALPDEFEAFHWHGDTFSLPEGSLPVASSPACENQGFLYGDSVLACQFHLETTVDGAISLIDNCAGEIIDGPYVQTTEHILTDDRKFQRINRIMEEVLNYLESLADKLY